MRRSLLLIACLALLPFPFASAQSGTEPAAATPATGDDLRRYLIGSTWTWKPEGKTPSEMLFRPDGTVKHNAFVGKWFVRSRSDVAIQVDRRSTVLTFDASYTHYTGKDLDGTLPLTGDQRVGSGAAATQAKAVGGKLGVSDPTLERDIANLSATHSAAVANAALPFNKRFQADLAPLLKRAQASGDAAMIRKIQSLVAAQNYNLDGTSWHLDGNAWVETLRFNHGILSVVPRNSVGSRDQAYRMSADGNVTFPFDGHEQKLIVAPDHAAVSWGGMVFEPQTEIK